MVAPGMNLIYCTYSRDQGKMRSVGNDKDNRNRSGDKNFGVQKYFLLILPQCDQALSAPQNQPRAFLEFGYNWGFCLICSY